MSDFVISPRLRVYVDRLKGPTFEKTIPYMYVDTEGKVTVGVGHNLTAHGDCQELKFVVKRLTRKAVKGGDQGIPIGEPKTIDRQAFNPEKQNDYDFLHKHKGLGHFAPHQLAAYTTLEMDLKDIAKLFEEDLQAHIAIARDAFGAAFDTYPVPCQAALIDIAFNCGSFKSFQTTFVPAVKGEGAYANKTWKERMQIAAKHSRRGKVNASRNAEIAKWLLESAEAGLP